MIPVKSSSLFDIFEETCKRNPQKAATHFTRGDDAISLTYQNLYDRSLFLANILSKNNIKKNDRVAVFLENSCYWPEAFFGVMRLGAVAVPLSCGMEEAQLTALLSHSEAKMILSSDGISQEIKGPAKVLSIPVVNLNEALLSQGASGNPLREIIPAIQPAAIVYTMEPAAKPKGMILTHANLIANAESLKRLRLITCDDHLLSLLPHYHMHPFMLNLLLPLLLGAKISFPGSKTSVKCLEYNGITILAGTPYSIGLLHKKINDNLKSYPAAQRSLVNVLLSAAAILRRSLKMNLSKKILKKLHKETVGSLRLLMNSGTRVSGHMAGDFYKWGFTLLEGYEHPETILLSSGDRINPEDLEAYYSRSRYIKEICVFISSSEKGDETLTAVVFPDLDYFRLRGVSQIKDKIRFEIEDLAAALPSYKRITSHMIVREDLPRTLLGKLKRPEIRDLYFQKSQAGEGVKSGNQLSEEDKLLLSSAVCQSVLEHLSRKLKRTVNLNDHLELDLGLDSLERISLFFELQKLVGFELDERKFFFVATVRDVLEKLRDAGICTVSAQKDDESQGWEKIFKSSSAIKDKFSIQIDQGWLEKLANLPFIFILKIFCRIFFLLSVKGRDNIPKNGPFILCPTHTSYLDGPVAAASLSTPSLLQTYFLGYSAYLDNPFLGWGKNLLRLIPLDPSSKLADTLTLCSLVLQNSKVLCMFPEGGRSIDGEVKKFKRGIGILIKELKCDVVPVHIRGTYAAWPISRILPRPAKVEVTFGKKITPQELTLNQIKDVDIYQNIADNLREEMIRFKKSL